MSKIKIENLSKSFGNTRVLSEVNFESSDDEFVVIVGPSGCGKTTLLRIIAGLEKPSSGMLFMDNEDLLSISPEKRDIAMVFQSYALYPNLSVYENLAFPLTMRNVKKKIIEKEVNAVAEKLELVELLNRKPGTLSGGQKQRVAIGRAMIRKPKAFLLDEPLSNLDASLREKMRGELVFLHNSISSLFFYVTHDQTEAMAMGDRIIIMNEGVVQQVDTPENIYNNPANMFVAGFIGTPHMNFFDEKIYKFLGGKNNIQNGAIVGIRPEDIIVEKDCNNNLSHGQISLVEPLGKETHVHVLYGEKMIVACTSKSPSELGLIPGDYVVCTGKLNKYHFFDKESGLALNK